MSKVCNATIFRVLVLLQDIYSSLWYAVRHLLGHILTDGSPFLDNQYLVCVGNWGFLFFHPPLEDWPKVLNGIKVRGVSWALTPNSDIFFTDLLNYHFRLMASPSFWRGHCLSSNNSWMVERTCTWRTSWSHSLFMAVFLVKTVSESTRPFLRSNYYFFISQIKVKQKYYSEWAHSFDWKATPHMNRPVLIEFVHWFSVLTRCLSINWIVRLLMLWNQCLMCRNYIRIYASTKSAIFNK